MWALGIPLLVLVLLTTLVNTYDAGGQDELQVQTDTELAMYRTFVSVADLHFRSVPAPAVKTTYQWSQIKVSAPPGITSAVMNPTWKAVRAPDGSWAACTELQEVALASVGGLFPAPETGMAMRSVNLLGAQTGIGVGAETVAVAAADLCKGA